jgi:phosphopantetheinyl transferase
MPLYNIFNAGPDRAWGLWKIEESLEHFHSLYPINKVELPHFETISHPHKQMEWYASRTTISKVCNHLQLPYLGTVKQMDNKPFLCDEAAHISISHSHDYAAAIIDKERVCGIDIEKIDKKILSIRKKFLQPKEFSDDPIKTTLYWCIKETGYKMHPSKGISLKDDIIIQSIPDDLYEGETMIWVRHVPIKVQFLVHDGYGIAFNL